MYLNHRGECELRDVTPMSLDFFTRPEYGYQPGWFISGMDNNRKAVRSFALSRIIFEELSVSRPFIRFPLSQLESNDA